MSKRVIYKYLVGPSTPLLAVGHRAKARSVGMQSNDMYLWVEVDDTDSPCDLLRVSVVATGEPFQESADFVGTVHHMGLVWHVFAGQS